MFRRLVMAIKKCYSSNSLNLEVRYFQDWKWKLKKLSTFYSSKIEFCSQDSENDFDTESELEDLTGIERTRQSYTELAKHRKRSRSESPYAKMLIAVAARKRSGLNSIKILQLVN